MSREHEAISVVKDLLPMAEGWMRHCMVMDGRSDREGPRREHAQAVEAARALLKEKVTPP